MNWILSRLRLMLWVMVAAPLIFAGFYLADLVYFYPQKKAVFDKGVEAVAHVDGGTRTKRRRSGTSFSLDLSWKDQSGAARTEKVSISKSLADKLIREDMLVVDNLKIKYLPGDANAPVLVLDDMPQSGPVPPTGMDMALGLIPVSLLGGGILYWMRRRAQKAAASAA